VKIEKKKSVLSLVNSDVNATLSASAAECRAAAPLLLGARRCRLISRPQGAQQQTRAAAAVD